MMNRVWIATSDGVGTWGKGGTSEEEHSYV